MITDQINLEKTEQLLIDGYADDRFSKDPLIKNNISKARLIGYLHKSFSNQPKEFLYGLINASTSNLVAFKTGEFINKNEVLFYLNGGLRNDGHTEYSNMLELSLINSLTEKGVKWFHAISSGLNLADMNLSKLGLNYNIESTKIILRKLYE